MSNPSGYTSPLAPIRSAIAQGKPVCVFIPYSQRRPGKFSGCGALEYRVCVEARDLDLVTCPDCLRGLA